MKSKEYYFKNPVLQEKMIKGNPYRKSGFWLKTPHELCNGRFMEGFICGRSYFTDMLLDYMKEKGLKRSDMPELISNLLQPVIEER